MQNAIGSTDSSGPRILAEWRSMSADTVLGGFAVCITPLVLAVTFLSAWYIVTPVGDNKWLSLWASDLNHWFIQKQIHVSVFMIESLNHLPFLKLKHQLM